MKEKVTKSSYNIKPMLFVVHLRVLVGFVTFCALLETEEQHMMEFMTRGYTWFNTGAYLKQMSVKCTGKSTINV